MDYRLYDLGWMCYQALASWDVESWGVVPIEKIGRFIEVYDRTMRECGSPLGELTKEEKEFFPVMMIIGAMKVIADFACYEDHEKDVHRVFINTWRFVDSVRFMRSHLEEIREAVLK